jgi:hypothetical protein
LRGTWRGSLRRASWALGAVVTTVVGLLSFAAAAEEWSTESATHGATISTQAGPAFESDGKLRFPTDYREWIFLSSGLDMSYSERSGAADHSMFDNVFAEPTAYREFVRTGKWPDGTLLLLEVRGATGKGSINQH